jgi:hypothetical protein
MDTVRRRIPDRADHHRRDARAGRLRHGPAGDGRRRIGDVCRPPRLDAPGGDVGRAVGLGDAIVKHSKGHDPMTLVAREPVGCGEIPARTQVASYIEIIIIRKFPNNLISFNNPGVVHWCHGTRGGPAGRTTMRRDSSEATHLKSVTFEIHYPPSPFHPRTPVFAQFSGVLNADGRLYAKLDRGSIPGTSASPGVPIRGFYATTLA